MQRHRMTEEQRDAAILAMRLASDPRVTKRRNDYEAQVARARVHARGMPYSEVVDALIANNPAYIRGLLETEDQRFGAGSLVERYARTFYSDFPA